MDQKTFFIFKRNQKLYVILAFDLESAWIILQKRINWRMELVKTSFFLIETVLPTQNLKIIEL